MGDTGDTGDTENKEDTVEVTNFFCEQKIIIEFTME